MDYSLILPILLFFVTAFCIATGMVVFGKLFGPRRRTDVKDMPYESGMDPFHDTHKRFDIRFHLVAISFLIFDVELLFLYPWAVASRNEEGFKELANQSQSGASREMIFAGVMVFIVLLAVGLIYDWRKGVFQWQKK